ncbi:hypothetical protein Q0N71_27445, partial [Bacillus thuringiensis]
VKVIVYEMLYLLEIPKLTFKTSSCAPLEFFLHFSGIAACTKQMIFMLVLIIRLFIRVEKRLKALEQ